VVNAVLAPSCRAALELGELHHEALVLKQIDGTAVDERQKVPIEFRFRFLGGFIVDVALLELLPRPFTAVPISVNLGAPVRLEQGGIFLDNSFGRKGRLALPHNVENLSFCLPCAQ
jgi:hypothetical protein